MELSRPNPSKVLEDLLVVVNYLEQECTWSPSRIHLFGFAQGGSVVLELALKFWQSGQYKKHIGSAVSICSALLSFPTMNTCPTPVLVIERPGSQQSALSKSD